MGISTSIWGCEGEKHKRKRAKANMGPHFFCFFSFCFFFFWVKILRAKWNWLFAARKGHVRGEERRQGNEKGMRHVDDSSDVSHWVPRLVQIKFFISIFFVIPAFFLGLSLSPLRSAFLTVKSAFWRQIRNPWRVSGRDGRVGFYSIQRRRRSLRETLEACFDPT